MSTQAVGAALGAAENQSLIAALLQQMHEKVAFSIMGYSMDAVRHGHGGAVWSGRLDFCRIDHEFQCECSDRFRKCRREQHRLPPFRQRAQDPPERRQKSHIHHAIGFIDRQDFNRRKVYRPLFHVIDQPARRRNHNMQRRVSKRRFADGCRRHQIWRRLRSPVLRLNVASDSFT